jgi:hypothetical protein
VHSDQQLRGETGQEPEDIHGWLVTRRVDELRPHPSYSRHGLAVSASQLSALTALDDQTSEEPIVVTQDGLIIDGYARVERARMLGRTTILCIEYARSAEEALKDLLERHRGSNRFNNFCRILLALDLEPLFRQKARANQRVGGEKKGSSNLTEAEKIDVTAKIAEAADSCAGNVTKVKQLLKTAIPEIVESLRRGEIFVHKAWLLSKQPPAKQREELALPQGEKRIKKDMRILASRHRSRSLTTLLDPSNLIRQLSALESRKPGSFHVFTSNARGKAVCLTRELLFELGAQQELIPHAKEPVA